MVKQEEHCNADEQQQWHPNTRLPIDFGHNVGGGHIDRDSGGDWQPDGDTVTNQHHREHSQQGSYAEYDGGGEGSRRTSSTRQHYRRDCEALGNFMQENRKENNPAQPVGNQEAGSDRDAIEKCVNDKAEQHRRALVMIQKLVVMSFLPEVEVSGDHVFKKVNDEVAEQHQKTSASAIAALHGDAGG